MGRVNGCKEERMDQRYGYGDTEDGYLDKAF